VNRAALMRALRANAVAAGALVGIVLLAAAVGGYILAHQRLNPPAWIPVIGESHFELRAELDTAQGILPGQGQAVNVSGVRVGDIASVDLVDGKAVATLNIEERFGRVYPNATLLLRPKTGLKDMVLELDPGSPSSGPRLKSGALVRSSSTQTDVNVADFLASLDGDTRDYLKLLVGGAGQALGDGGGRDLANAFRRLSPLSRDGAKASRLVAQRRAKLRRVISNFSDLTTTLGAHDRQVTRFVSASSAVFRRFANQNQNLASAIELLPPALASGNRAFAKLRRLGDTAATTLQELRPTARALGPTLKASQPFFRETVAPFRDQLRPFAREARPTAHALVPATRDFADSTNELTKLSGVLKALANELAYDPPGKGVGKEGYLFYGLWAAHNSDSVLAQQDGIGPLRRGVIFIGCSQLDLLDSIARGGRNPQLSALITLLNAPNSAKIGCKSGSGG
jgi:phospholipid/cholesterol/gamma-HCH transport system substrate-binding protein